MPSQLTLQITSGPLAGSFFAFDAHDILLFGRHSQCHARLLKDRAVSRHHFLLEVNPPEATLRDLGSRNGTFVNGVRHGGRALNETPQQGSARTYPEVKLKQGDRITVGNTTIEVRIRTSSVCSHCGAEPPANSATIENDEQSYICPDCQRKLATTPYLPPESKSTLCQKCGRESTELFEPAEPYICPQCRDKPKRSAGLADLLDRARRGGSGSNASLAVAGYEIAELLGKGGMGAVYRAVRTRDGAVVAIKGMLPGVAVSEQARQRFLREIDIVRQLRHPNLVSLLEHGSTSGSFYFVMDYCNGGSVDRLLHRYGGKLPFDLAASVMRQCLHGLEYAHVARFVHRDLKPQNLLFHESPANESQGQFHVKISDFGLAKSLETAGLSGMTATGNTGGTYAFMPREQLTDFKRVEPVSDVWSIAATFYYLLTSAYPRPVSRGRDPIEVILQEEALPLAERAPHVPAAVAQVIDRALASAPGERFADAGQMREAIEHALRG